MLLPVLIVVIMMAMVLLATQLHHGRQHRLT
jgi:hypothetical protein